MPDRVPVDVRKRKAAAACATADDKTLSLDCTMASEDMVRMYDYERGETVHEVLTMNGLEDMPATVPLLNSHTRDGIENVLGHVEGIRIDGNRLAGRVVFARTDPAGKSAFEKYRDGHLTDFSVGYQIHEAARIEAGESAEIAGRKWTAPEGMALKVATKWRVRELSAVAIGADPQAKARQEQHDSEAGHVGVPHIQERNMETKLDVAVPPAETREEAKVIPIDLEMVKREAIAAERKRMADIETEMKGVELTTDQAVEIRSAETVDQARAQLLDIIRSKKPAAVIIPKDETPVDSMRAIECAAVRTSGVGEEALVKEYGAPVMEQAKRFRNIGPLGICRNMLRLAGKHVPDDAGETVRAAFELSARSDAASSMHLGFVLGNIANKSLLKGYSEQADTWSQWCTIREVADYKLNTAARFGMVDSFEEVGNGGEVKHATAKEEGETFQVGLYAEAFNITEKNLVNDDQGVFSTVPSRLGAAAKRFISKTVYTAVLANGTMNDGYSWLGTDHSNYISGTDTAMSTTYGVGALDLAIAAMLKQTGLEGEPLDLQPSILLVPPDLAAVANALYTSEHVVSGITNRVGNANPYRGMFKNLVEPRLSNTGYSGYSAAKWYLIDPRVENFLVAFLRGNREPRIESFTMDPATFGIKYRASVRFGVQETDYRGIVLAAGA